MDWKIIIRPLLEKNMFNAKEGELIVDKKTGHITFKRKGKFKSKTKELEAQINALLGYKNELIKEFIKNAEDIDTLVKNFDSIRDDTKKVKEKAEELKINLEEIEMKLNELMTDVSKFSLEIKNFQYQEIRNYLDPIITNLKDTLSIKASIDELKFLANDIKNQKISNNDGKKLI
ncbi:hypothetical protein Bp8pS_021 [Bacillus phage vB_BpuM-BpSp]|nr:hypothetical protein Bp8pS_021 [Bacillus phage vB_BpuM-BpSp]